jgi:DNA-binding transcriptional ArsR family regulator
VAKSNGLGRKMQSVLAGSPAASARPRRGHLSRTAEFDRLIHEQIRLGIVSALAVNNSLSFNDLKQILKTTDGNLSVHARKLEAAGYVTCRKFFQGRMPKTEFRLAATGRRALETYLEQMEALIRAARTQEG